MFLLVGFGSMTKVGGETNRDIYMRMSFLRLSFWLVDNG